jgi:hypothetical protein
VSRPRWVEIYGEPAILISEGPGEAALVRYATGTRSQDSYHTVLRSTVVRRPEWDDRPEPAWLTRARTSSRPPHVLWSLLHEDDSTTPPVPMFDTDADGRPREEQTDGHT